MNFINYVQQKQLRLSKSKPIIWMDGGLQIKQNKSYCESKFGKYPKI